MQLTFFDMLHVEPNVSTCRQSTWWMAHVSVCFLFQTYLSLRQAEADSQFGFPPDGDVSVEMKLFLQLQPLMVCINYSVLLLRSCFTCEVDKNTRYNFSIFRLFVVFISNLSVFIFVGRLLNWKIPTVETCMPGRAYLHAASSLVCFSNLHLICFRNANWAVLSCVYKCRTVNFKEAAIRSSTVTSRKAKVHKLLGFNDTEWS